MPAPPTSDLRVVKYAERWGYAAAEWERALGQIDWSRPHAEGGPQRLKIKTLPDGTRDATVWRATLHLGKHDHEVVLKVEPLGSIRKKLQAWLHRTKAFRQWRGAAWLNGAHIRSAAPLAILRSARAEIFVMQSIDAPDLLQVIASGTLSVGAQHELAKRVAHLAYHMMDARMINRDHKGSNLIVLSPSTPPNANSGTHRDWNERMFGIPSVVVPDSHIVVVDAEGVSKGSASLLSFLVPIAIESLGVGALPRRPLLARALSELAQILTNNQDHFPDHWGTGPTTTRELWVKCQEMVHAHGDPTPKDDPLARG